MPEYIRTLVLIIILSVPVFIFSKQFASDYITKTDLRFRRNLWFSFTIIAFLAQNFWVYAMVVSLLLLFPAQREKNKTALFFFTLFALPVATIQIPGMGLINYLFAVSHVRLLEIFILLPAFLSLTRNSDCVSFGRMGPDKVLVVYLILKAVLNLRDSTITDTLRYSFYEFIDVFLPYFVVSRSLTRLQTFRDSLVSFDIAIMLLAIFGAFESIKQWLLYFPLLGSLGLEGLTGYLERDGHLRAIASAGQPIVFGYLMVVGIGFYLFSRNSIKKSFFRTLGLSVLVAGLLASISRGPWVGAAVLFIVFLATGPHPIKHLTRLALIAVIAIPVIAILPGGQKMINLLPFLGTAEKSTIDYRQDLISNSFIVIQRNPWFGSTDFLDNPEMEVLRQGGKNGIIDIVNTYIGIALEIGIVGLLLFVGFFALVVGGIYRAMLSLPDKDSEEHLLGRVLLASLLAILVIIFTVSDVTFVPIVYWCVAGLGVAYAQMVRGQTTEDF